MTERLTDRVMIFIDGSNTFRAFRRFRPDVKYDIRKLIDKLLRGRKLVRPYYFGSERIPPNEGQRKFYDAIRNQGIDVTIRPLKLRSRSTKCPRCKHTWSESAEVEKGVDVALVTKMLSFGFKDVYDVAILVSGDEDYVDAIEQIRDLGKRVEIVAFKGALAPSLRRLADVDGLIYLDDIADDIKRT